MSIEVIFPGKATRAQVANVSMSLLLMNRHVALHVALLRELLQADRTRVAGAAQQVIPTGDARLRVRVTAARASDQRQVMERMVVHLQRKTVHNALRGSQPASERSPLSCKRQPASMLRRMPTPSLSLSLLPCIHSLTRSSLRTHPSSAAARCWGRPATRGGLRSSAAPPGAAGPVPRSVRPSVTLGRHRHRHFRRRRL